MILAVNLLVLFYDPDFYKAVQKGNLDKLDEVKTSIKKGKLSGTLDGLTLDEKKVVQDLLDSGKNIQIIPRSNRKTADFLINGVKTELKTLQNSNANTAITRIQEAFKQGMLYSLMLEKRTLIRMRLIR